MFNSSTYESMYSRFLGPLAQPVVIHHNTGSGFLPYAIKAHVTNLRETELVPESSLRVGDLRLIILWEDMWPTGLSEVSLKDRIEIDGKAYAPLQYDSYTRKIGEDPVAAELFVRGGGLSLPSDTTLYIIDESGNQMVDETGVDDIVHEAHQ